MIRTEERSELKNRIIFCENESIPGFSGKWTRFGRKWEYRAAVGDGVLLYIRYRSRPAVRDVKEIMAMAADFMKREEIHEYTVELAAVAKAMGDSAIRAAVEGIYTGCYEITLPGREKKAIPEVAFSGISDTEKGNEWLEEAVCLAETQSWVRDLVNAPGNLLQPMDFARTVIEKMEDVQVESELLVFGRLNDMGMHALTAVGASSENPPCMLVLRYRGAEDSGEVTGIIGKGVTCDTGGYCLKSADSMYGIKGDMAGGAAVGGAIYALAKNRIRTNLTAVIPMCENRISPTSLVPGDVIDSYGGKLIEIRNTDAEGRLIMADAMAYLVKNEKVNRVLDIATLTGAVVSMLGFTTAGVISDDEQFFSAFMKGTNRSGERYWRLPFFEEQEEMLKSEVADIRNLGESYCGTITAGLFVRAFAEGKPWLHLDIAGTAWTDRAFYQGQPKGATGAGMTSIYHMFAAEAEKEKACG